MAILAIDITFGLYALLKAILMLPGVAYRSTKSKLTKKIGGSKELKTLD